MDSDLSQEEYDAIPNLWMVMKNGEPVYDGSKEECEEWFDKNVDLSMDEVIQYHIEECV